MKLLSLFILSFKAQDTTEQNTHMAVKENDHTLCNTAELSSEFECHANDNFLRCSASYGVDTFKKRRCECYKSWMMLAMYE